MSRPALSAVPASRSSLPILKIRRRVVLGLLIFTSCVGLFAGLAWLLAPSQVISAEAPRSEPAIALATTVAHDYLAGRDTIVPAGTGVDVKFADNGPVIPKARITFAGSSQYRLGDAQSLGVEKVTFDVIDPSPEEAPRAYKLTVLMAHAPTGWVLSASPSIEPAQLAKEQDIPGYKELFTTGGEPSQLGKLPQAEGIRSQVEKWAELYAAEGANSDALFSLTGDTDSSRTYDGLGGWKTLDVSIRSYLTGENGPETAADFGSTWVVVRLALVLEPPAATGSTVTAEYDVLLQPEKNPAAPPVTAWGPAGVGPTSDLTNFVNSTNG